jgi:phosphopantothenoylcysteine decarboxylase/phosphopantothenate--cysteine ligase
MRFLITAGATREYIDPVRFISNASSGRMGYALAHAALKAGHNVTLITTIENPKSEIRNPKLKVIKVETAAQMFDAVKRHFPRCDCLIMAAAVADYTPAHPAKTKIKKQNKPLTIKLKPTPDILKWAGAHKKEQGNNKGTKAQRRKEQLVVGFALEDKNIRQNAEKKLRDKNLDMIIANTPAAIGAGKISVQIKTPDRKWLKLPKASKTTIAQKIIALAEKIKKERQKNEDED